MQVSELMNRELITVAPEDSVEEAVKLLRRRGIRHLLVMKKGRLVGIISDRDLKRALDPAKTTKKLMGVGGLYFLMEPILIEEIMTPNPVTIGPDTSIDHAAFIIVERRFGALPVVQDGDTVGIVTETDLLRYYASTGMERELDDEDLGILESRA
jgi:acetoin utilization protein AcuB